jgi:ATP-binding cassette subfamily C (CFTR/MRP) protein 1
MMRGCLVTMIYDKTLELTSTKDHERYAMTLMSNDVQRVVRGMRNFHEIWASTLEAGIAMWLLYSEIGLAFVAVVGLFIGEYIHLAIAIT